MRRDLGYPRGARAGFKFDHFRMATTPVYKDIEHECMEARAEIVRKTREQQIVQRVKNYPNDKRP